MAAALFVLVATSTAPPGALALQSPAPPTTEANRPAVAIPAPAGADPRLTAPPAGPADAASPALALGAVAVEALERFDPLATDALALEPMVLASVAPPPTPDPEPEPTPEPSATPKPRPEAADRDAQAAPRVVRAAARPAKMWSQLRRGLAVTGRATWYGASRGYAGTPHIAMPGARYLSPGRAAPRVRVCVDGRCAVLPVVDACGCHAGARNARIVDLSRAALQRLRLDPGRGVYRVRVTLVED